MLKVVLNPYWMVPLIVPLKLDHAYFAASLIKASRSAILLEWLTLVPGLPDLTMKAFGTLLTP